MQNQTRTPKIVLSDGQIPREKFDDSVTSGDANFSKDAKSGAEKNPAYFFDCESDSEEKNSGDEIGEFGLTKDGEIQENMKMNYKQKTFNKNFTPEQEPQGDSEFESSDSDSTHSIKEMNFADDETDRVDRLTFYKHQRTVTQKTWTVDRPETTRLVYVPFLAQPNGKPSLVHISTKLLFVKQPYFEHSIYLSFLSIHNESDNLTSYMVKCSNPKKLQVQPSLGFIKPKGSVKVSFSTDRTFAYEFYELLHESVTVYVAPFKIMESDEKKMQMVDNQSRLKAIGLLHFEDFWRSYGTPWFPKAEIHQIKNFIPSDPGFSQRTILMGLKACIRDVRMSIADWFNNGSKDEAEELIGQTQTDYYDSKINCGQYLRLERTLMGITKSFKNDRGIWKLCKLVLCSIGLYIVLTSNGTYIKIVFGSKEEPQSIWSWSWWRSWF